MLRDQRVVSEAAGWKFPAEVGLAKETKSPKRGSAHELPVAEEFMTSSFDSEFCTYMSWLHDM